MLKLQSLLGCELIKPGRILLKQGELQKICRKGMQPRYFVLVICRSQKWKFLTHSWCRIPVQWLSDVHLVPRIGAAARTQDEFGNPAAHGASASQLDGGLPQRVQHHQRQEEFHRSRWVGFD
jgi:hypothetical protein